MALKGLSSSAENSLKAGAASLTKMIPGMSGCDPTSVVNGLLKMAKMAIGPMGCCPPPKNNSPHDLGCCCGNPGGPEEIIHLPGKDGIPMCKADPKAVIDAMFPPLPPAKTPAGAPLAKPALPGAGIPPPASAHGLQNLVHSKTTPPQPTSAPQTIAQPAAAGAA